MPSANLELLKQVAKRLGSLLPEVVFVGGCTTELFITDEAAPEVRPTFDVDVIAEITSYVGLRYFLGTPAGPRLSGRHASGPTLSLADRRNETGRNAHRR